MILTMPQNRRDLRRLETVVVSLCLGFAIDVMFGAGLPQ